MKFDIKSNSSANFQLLHTLITELQPTCPTRDLKLLAVAIRAPNCLEDDQGQRFSRGWLHDQDLAHAKTVLAYPAYLHRTLVKHADTLNDADILIFQAERQCLDSERFIYGMALLDDQLNLIDYCLDTQAQHQRRTVMQALIAALCRPDPSQIDHHWQYHLQGDVSHARRHHRPLVSLARSATRIFSGSRAAASDGTFDAIGFLNGIDERSQRTATP